MIISDLEYIESAENSEIQGGCYYANTKPQADGDFQADGDETNAYTDTFTDVKVGYKNGRRHRAG
jgi:hypothetical protein